MTSTRHQEITELLTNYGKELVAAGFEVWLTNNTSNPYLQYRDPETGACGSLQQSYYDGWQHLMPIVPSRENGSSMFLEHPADPFTVQAARDCAQPFNYNHLTGRQPNAADKTWRSDSAVPLHPTTI